MTADAIVHTPPCVFRRCHEFAPPPFSGVDRQSGSRQAAVCLLMRGGRARRAPAVGRFKLHSITVSGFKSWKKKKSIVFGQDGLTCEMNETTAVSSEDIHVEQKLYTRLLYCSARQGTCTVRSAQKRHSNHTAVLLSNIFSLNPEKAWRFPCPCKKQEGPRGRIGVPSPNVQHTAAAVHWLSLSAVVTHDMLYVLDAYSFVLEVLSYIIPGTKVYAYIFAPSSSILKFEVSFLILLVCWLPQLCILLLCLVVHTAVVAYPVQQYLVSTKYCCTRYSHEPRTIRRGNKLLASQQQYRVVSSSFDPDLRTNSYLFDECIFYSWLVRYILEYSSITIIS